MIILEMPGRLIPMLRNSANKMGENGSYIKTIWGMGYKFEV